MARKRALIVNAALKAFLERGYGMVDHVHLVHAVEHLLLQDLFQLLHHATVRDAVDVKVDADALGKVCTGYRRRQRHQ